LGVDAVLTHVTNFLYPPRCAVCGDRFGLAAEGRVCATCLARVEKIRAPICAICGGPMQSANANSATAIEAAASESRCTDCVDRPPNFARARAVARYRPAAESDHRSLPSLIRRHKYGLDQSLQKALGEFLGQELPFSTADCDLVIPVPLHRRRLWWRGFNQAALLARTIARRLDKPLELGALVRVRMTPPQTDQDHDARRRNVRRAFSVARPVRIKGRRVLLVDDVMTTGATVDECARVLIAAGAARVDVLTLARVW
jgi:ComF family protein